MNWIIVSKLLCIIMCYVLIVILDNTVGIPFACVLNELSLIFITNIVNEVAFVQLKWQGKK